MAMDFPSNPTVGQTYSVTGGPTYTWSGTAWRVLTPGNQFNRTTFTATAGQTVFSVIYTLGAVDVFRNGVKLVSGPDFTATDGATITLANAATVGDTIEVIAYSQVVYATAAKAEDVYSVVRGMKNRIINGGMQVWQRGTSFSGGGSIYSADRWVTTYPATGVTTSQSSDVPSQVWAYSLSIAGSNYPTITQRIESRNCLDLYNQPVTVSFWLKQTVGGGSGSISVLLDVISSTDDWTGAWTQPSPIQTVSGTGTWTFYTLTFGAMPSSVKNGLQLRIFGNTSGSSTFLITGVQLEAGAVTNPVFERRPYGLELQLCQRYCQVYTFAGYQYIGVGQANNSTGQLTTFKLVQPMRAAPTLSSVTTAASTFGVGNYGNTTLTATSISLNQATSDVVTLAAGVSSGLTAGNASMLGANNTTAKLGFDAEL